jgi:hypothetical protein
MNDRLTKEIISHIFSHFGINTTGSTKSLNSPEFLLPEKLKIQEDDKIFNYNIWGYQLAIDQEITFLLVECSKEFALFISMKDHPSYGLYFSDQPLIACSLNGKDWMICNLYLQATFLAGMEQLRELNYPGKKATNYQEQYQSLLSFIEYRDSLFEVKND